MDIGVAMSLTILNGSQSKALSPHRASPRRCQQCLHLIPAPSSNNPTSAPETHSQGEKIHRRRQTCGSIGYAVDLNVSAQPCQHSQIHWLHHPEASSSSVREEENSGSTDIHNDPSSSQFHSLPYLCESDSHLDTEAFQIPPPPSDLLALHETWEHIRACCSVERMVSNRSLIQYSSFYTDKHRLLGTSLATSLPARLRSRKQNTNGTRCYIPATFESRTHSHNSFQLSSKVSARLLKNVFRHSGLRNS